MPRIFERFKQADGTATRPLYGGLGLGLSIVRHVVESHGGRAEAHSDGEGCGATLIIELPTEAPTGEAEVPSSTRSGEAAADRTRLVGARVLLVDDNDDSREFLATALEAAGAELRARSAACTTPSRRWGRGART